MKIEDIIKENSSLEDFEILVRKPFKLTNRGIYVLSKSTQNQGKITHYHNHSAIGTTFFSYVAHELDRYEIKEGADLLRQAIQPLQEYECIPQNKENEDIRDVAKKSFLSRLRKVKSEPNLTKINQITGLEFWHFLWATDVASRKVQKRDEASTILHFMNNALCVIDIYYNKATEFSLTSDKNKWRKNFEKR